MVHRKFLFGVALLSIIGFSRTAIAQVQQVSVADENVTVCPNTRIQLLAPQGALSPKWTPVEGLSATNDQNPITTITQTTTFEVTYLYDTGINLVTNGDFEKGNTGFVSQYIYKRPNGATTLHPEGYYTVYSNAREVHNYWGRVYDHTSGRGNYLIANGDTKPNRVVWEQTIHVEPNQDYIFQAYAVNFLDNPAQLQFSIEGVQLGNIFTLQGKEEWNHFYEVWNSGNYNGNITIRLLNQRTEPNGNDFGVDDISFKKLDEKTKSVTVTVPETNKIITETACEEYEWHGVVYTESGTYVHNYTNELGCSSSETLLLTINKGTHTTLRETACEEYEWHGVVYRESGEYEYRTTTAEGCELLEVLKLTVHKLNYDIEYVLLDCKLRKYQFLAKNNAQTKNDKIEWIIDGKSYIENAPEVALTEGEHQIRLVVTSPVGCKKEFESMLSVSHYYDQYTIEATPQVVSKSKPTIRLYTEYRPNVSYEWNFGDNAYGFENDVVHTYQIDQEKFYDVYLTVTDENDCVEERKIRILVDNTISAPNVFTPNADGYNDLFMRGWHIKIFDRRGVLLYEGDKGWDGTYMNKMVSNDTYFYILTDGGVTKKGFITVIR